MKETVFFAENAVYENMKIQERVDSRVSFYGGTGSWAAVVVELDPLIALAAFN